MSKINEAGIGDMFKRWDASILGALGDNKAKGRKELLTIKKALEDDFEKFMGKTNKNASTATLIDFLVKKVNFTVNNAKNFLADGGLAFDRQETSELPKQTLDTVFTKAAEYAAEHNLVQTPNDKNKEKSKEDIKRDKLERSSRSSRERSTERRRGADIDDDIEKIRKATEEPSSAKGESSKNDDAFSFSKTEYSNVLKKSGLTAEHIEDLVDIVDNAKSFTSLNKRPDAAELQRQLAAIGYSIFKAMEKK